jgi:hypothetical protein
MELDAFVAAFAFGIQSADAEQPVALNKRSGQPYLAGIGPHTEAETTTQALSAAVKRARCDVLLDGVPGWAIEIKMLRLMGDNGKPNDNMLMHILSPYAVHRSALTDCTKLLHSGFVERKAIVIFGYDYVELPMEPAVDAFEALASRTVSLSRGTVSAFDCAVHPVHQCGKVFGWEITERESSPTDRVVPVTA